MKTTTLALLLLFFLQSLSAQTPTKSKADNYLEGGKLLVDIVKIFKNKEGEEEKEADCDDEISKLCFQNKTQSTVKIKVEMKTDEKESTELIIPVKGKECSYLTTSGIYKYEINLQEKDGTDSLIRKGEFNIKDCIEIFIKVEDP